MKVAILFLLFAVSFVSARVFNQNADNSLSCCTASTTFNPSTQVCCGGVVSTIPSGSSGECCGTTALPAGRTCCRRDDGLFRTTDRSFDSTNSQCCDGTVNSGTTRTCCGTGTLDASVDLCCSGVRIANGLRDGRTCCATGSYNAATDTCCIITKADGTVDRFQVNTGALSGTNAAAPRDQCCGLTAFNSNRQICCAGSLTTAAAADDASTYSCCGSTGFNSQNRICCGTTLFSPGSGQTVNDLACCGSRTFLPATQQCCSDGRNFGVATTSQTCCGTVGIDSNTQLCCAGNTVRSSNNGNLQCCGSSTFTPATQICCDESGASPRAIASNLQCCGNNGYDSSRQTCCIDANGNGVVGSDLSRTSCCNGVAYNPNTNSCPCGKVILIGSDLTNNPNTIPSCCGDDQYDTYTDFCCRPVRVINATLSVVLPIRYFDGLPELAGYSCCLNDTSKAYNPGYQVCCEYKKKGSGRVVKPVCGNACCQASRKSKPRGYFTQYQFCCGGRPLDYTDDTTNAGAYACCGSNLYTTNFFACCADDNQVWDPLTQLCCSSVSA